MDNPSREQLLNLSEEKPIGLIYSRSELHEYFVELLDHKENHYLHKRKELASFDSVDDALAGARKQGAQEFYLCLDNTYDECGSESVGRRFCYMQIRPA
tara:strand:- start:507 stop:803 length:297 start_codon:yes stop_codon:yes gene_type:complete